MKTRTSRTTAEEGYPPVDVTQWWSPPTMNAALRAGETYAAWNGEIIRFATDRLRQDGEFGLALAKCRDWNEATELQRDWATKATQDYFEEGRRLLRLATRWSADTAAMSERA